MTAPQLTLLSPAKLNLFLHITGRRPDGYHTLQTLFQLLDWGDTLSFTPNNSGQIQLSGAIPGVAAQDNLIVRAARCLTTDIPGAHIHVKKRIPMGGGLGGGSSNAATTLVALNHLWGCNHNRAALAAMGAELGADVPVFIAGNTAWAEGIGEILTPVELPEHWYLVVAPACQVATAQIFSHDQLTRNSPAIKMAAFFQGGSRNDCQDLVRRLYPEVDKALNFLGKFGEARLTGTGSCVFVRCDTEEQAATARDEVPDKWQSFIARGVNHSPLADELD